MNERYRTSELRPDWFRYASYRSGAINRTEWLDRRVLEASDCWYCSACASYCQHANRPTQPLRPCQPIRPSYRQAGHRALRHPQQQATSRSKPVALPAQVNSYAEARSGFSAIRMVEGNPLSRVRRLALTAFALAPTDLSRHARRNQRHPAPSRGRMCRLLILLGARHTPARCSKEGALGVGLVLC